MSTTSSSPTQAWLTPAALSQGLLFLEQTRNGMLGAVKLLTPVQWTFKPSPERWSIGEIAGHVVAVQERVIGMLRQHLAAAPPPPPEQNCEVVDSIVIHQIPGRLSKFPSPIPAAPALDKAETLRLYTDNCAIFAEMLETTPDLRGHALESRPLTAISKGAYTVMDGYQWILAAAAHAERHTKQLLEVIADDSFPE